MEGALDGERASVTRVDTDGGVDWQARDGGCRLQPGELVPQTRLEIRNWIGEGGMGQVYEAVHVDLGRHVALKVLQSRLDLSPDRSAQFLHEAQACAKVESRFVVKVLDFGELPDGRPFFVMELLGRETVHSALELGWMTLERAVPILRQCCKALAAVHEAGLVHRDIKPKNVVLQREDGRADTVRLVDFGLAAEPDSSPNISGTPPYMAPEQIRGEAFDGRVDIYALGCMAYVMLSGRVPFSDSGMKVLDAHIEHTPPALTTLRPTLPEALDPILLRCLEKQPGRRWASPHELEAALLELQSSLGFVTPWDDLPMPLVDEDRRKRLAELMPRANRRSPWIMVAGLGATLTIGGAVGLLLADNDPASPAEAQLAEPRDDARIEELTNSTRLAASKAYWVYPAADDPEQATALHWIDALESERGPLAEQAKARAAELRSELAETLVRLGDRYWAAPHGRSFALEYYALALVFVPELSLPAERIPLTRVQLSDLAARARRGEFSPAELRTAEAMAILAEEDPERRRERAVALLEREDYAMSLHSVEELAELVGAPSARAASPAPASEDQPPTSEVQAPASEVQKPTRDPARAAALVEQARAAAARGDRSGARRAFTEALEVDSRSVDALVGLAELHFEAGNYGKALPHARKASQLRPRDADLHVLVGDCYLKALRYTPARAAYKKAARRGHPKAASRLAHLDEVTQ